MWWGFILDTASRWLELPQDKVAKMVELLFDPTWDFGDRRVRRIDAQPLGGNAAFWEPVAPAITPEISSLFKGMGGPEQDSPFLEPVGTEGKITRDWEELGYSMEHMRNLSGNKKQWRSRFGSALAGVLRRSSAPRCRARRLRSPGWEAMRRRS